MKVETQSSNNIEQKETTTQISEEETQILASVNLPFSEILSQQMNSEDSEINNEIYSLNAEYNYDSLSMDINDAMLFVNLAQNGQINALQNQDGSFNSLIQTEVVQNTVSARSVEITNKLSELIEKAQTEQKPVRISFDNDVSVILKVDKNGKLSAEFIPGSLEVENYLRNNIAALRQKFDEQNLPYNDLLYRQNSKQNKKNDKNKGE